MKKLFLILSIILVIIIVTFFLLFDKYDKADDLQILNDTSYFSNFYVKGEKVYIQCEITIKNNYSDDKIFKLNANFKDDVKLGLLKNENLKGYNQDLTSDELKVEKNSIATVKVVFLGDFAGTNKKHDRDLPEITIDIVK